MRQQLSKTGMMNRYLKFSAAFLFLFLTCTSWSRAQERITDRVENVVHHVNAVKEIIHTPKRDMSLRDKVVRLCGMVDTFLQERHISTDTFYVARPEHPWTFKFRYDNKSTFYMDEERVEDSYFKYYFENEVNSSVAASVNYRGLSLSLSLNPNKILGKNTDTEFNFNYYNNKFGFDITYSDVKRFRGSTHYSDLWFKKPWKRTYENDGGLDYWGNTRLNSLSANIYYVFNHRRFSYPAAFSHSWVQKRSSGSIVAGATYYTGKIDFDLESIDADQAEFLRNMSEQTRMKYVALNLGYAYNYVPSRHWLVHASVTPGLMLWKNYEMDLVDFSVDSQTHDVECVSRGTSTIPKRFFDWTGVARLGVTYSWKNYFVGTTFVSQFDKVGDRNLISVFGCRWKLRSYFGLRL